MHKSNFPNDENRLRKVLEMFGVSQLADYLVWIPYREFSTLEKMGDGGFGAVYRARVNIHSQKDGKVVALKIMKANSSSKELLRNEVNNELLWDEVNVYTYLTSTKRLRF